MIKVDNYFSSKVYNNSYLVKIDKRVYLIDPTIEINKLINITDKLDGIIVTHSHIDHILYLEETLEQYKCPLYISSKCELLINDINKTYATSFNLTKSFNLDELKNKYNVVLLNDGDNINSDFKVIATPGHTVDSICLKVINQDELVLFTGDTLFDSNVGRSDLYSGNTMTLVKSLQKLFNEVDLNTKFYPGHDDASHLDVQLENNHNSFVCRIINRKI